MNLRPYLRTRNDILKDIYLLILPPSYSFIKQGCRSKEVRHAFGLCFLELILFTLDVSGGSNSICLVLSFILSLVNLPLTVYWVYFIKSSKITVYNKAEAQQLHTIEIISAVIQPILSGINNFITRSTVNNIPSLFPLALALTALVFAFRNNKGVPLTSSYTSDCSPPPSPPPPVPIEDIHVEVDQQSTVQRNEEVVSIEIPDEKLEASTGASTATLSRRKNAQSVLGNTDEKWNADEGMKNDPEEHRVTFRTKSDLEAMDDGFKWRKYGKKTVKNSPHPRNYYKCSSEGCNVKKRVERDREDPSYVITTYDGIHNHQSPSHSPTI